METKQKSDVELATDELIEKFEPYVITVDFGAGMTKSKWATFCAIQAQQMVVDVLTEEHSLYCDLTLRKRKEEMILTELKSRL